MIYDLTFYPKGRKPFTVEHLSDRQVAWWRSTYPAYRSRARALC